MMKIKRGMKFKSKTNGRRIKIISKASGNGHWNCKQIDGGRQSHHIHEGTLRKFYDVEEYLKAKG